MIEGDWNKMSWKASTESLPLTDRKDYQEGS